MSNYVFKILGNPVAKGRHRMFRRKDGGMGSYTPEKTNKWQEEIKIQIIKHKKRPEKPLKTPLLMNLSFNMPRPKSLPQKVIYHTKGFTFHG